MRLVFTSSTDGKRFIPCMSNLRNGSPLKHASLGWSGSYTFLESALTLPRPLFISQAGRRRTGGTGRLCQRHTCPSSRDVRAGRRVPHHPPQAPEPTSNLSNVRPRPDEIAASLCGRCGGGEVRTLKQTDSTFEFGGPRIYSYEELIKVVACAAN